MLLMDKPEEWASFLDLVTRYFKNNSKSNYFEISRSDFDMYFSSNDLSSSERTKLLGAKGDNICIILRRNWSDKLHELDRTLDQALASTKTFKSIYYQPGFLHKGIIRIKHDLQDKALASLKDIIRSGTGTEDPVYQNIDSAMTISDALQMIGINVHIDNSTYVLSQAYPEQLHQSIWYMGGSEFLSGLEDYIMDGSIIETDNGFDQLYTFTFIDGCIAEEWHSIYRNDDGSCEIYDYVNTQAD